MTIRHLLFAALAIISPEAFWAACDACGLAVKEVCYIFGKRGRDGEWKPMDRALLMRQLEGPDKFDTALLKRMSLRWNKEWRAALVEEVGPPARWRRAAFLQLAVMGTKQQLRMKLQPQQEAKVG